MTNNGNKYSTDEERCEAWRIDNEKYKARLEFYKQERLKKRNQPKNVVVKPRNQSARNGKPDIFDSNDYSSFIITEEQMMKGGNNFSIDQHSSLIAARDLCPKCKYVMSCNKRKCFYSSTSGIFRRREFENDCFEMEGAGLFV